MKAAKGRGRAALGGTPRPRLDGNSTMPHSREERSGRILSARVSRSHSVASPKLRGPPAAASCSRAAAIAAPLALVMAGESEVSRIVAKTSAGLVSPFRLTSILLRLVPQPAEVDLQPFEALRAEHDVAFERLGDAVEAVAQEQALQSSGLGIEQPVLGDADRSVIAQFLDAVLGAAARGDDLHGEVGMPLLQPVLLAPGEVAAAVELHVGHRPAPVVDADLVARGQHFAGIPRPTPMREVGDEQGYDALVRARRHLDLHQIAVQQLA